MSKKKSWAVQFKEFRVFAECVLDYLRSQVIVNDLEETQKQKPGSGDERPLCASDCHGQRLGSGRASSGEAIQTVLSFLDTILPFILRISAFRLVRFPD